MSASTASLRPRTDPTWWCGLPRPPSWAASVRSKRKTVDWIAAEQTPTSPTLAAVPVPTGHPQRWLILGILCVCLVLVVASVSSLNIAIPQIQKMLGGLFVFAIASSAAATVDIPTHLIALRAVMGVGAAFIMPSTLSLLTSVFPAHERPKAIAVWAGFAGGGMAVGVVASGLLLEKFWWGSVFAIIEGPSRGWSDPIVIGGFVASVLGLAFFVM